MHRDDDPAVCLLPPGGTNKANVLALAFQGGNYINFSDFNQPVSINVPDSCPSRPAVPPGQVAVIC